MKKLRVANGFLAQAASLLEEGSSVRLRIDGGSMRPFIRGGEDEVCLLPAPPVDDIPLGSCLFYCWQGQYMVHRYVGREGDVLVLMGDGNLVQKERISSAEVIGILSRIYHKDGSISDCLSAKWLRKGRNWYRMRFFRQILLSLCR